MTNALRRMTEVVVIFLAAWSEFRATDKLDDTSTACIITFAVMPIGVSRGYKLHCSY